MFAVVESERGGHLVCLYCNTVFIFEEQERLYSPILMEFVNMVHEEVAPPVVYTAQEVGRAIE